MNRLYTLFIFSLITFSTLLLAEEKHLVGGDVSLLPRYEQYKTPYYDQNGATINDVLLYMRDECGMNAMRVRLFVNPNASEAKDGVVQDLAYVKALGKRIKDAGLKFMLDFHYSDTWADPSNQKLPADWSDCKTAEQKAEQVYSYTKDCLNELKSAGATPDFVQVGNEISYGIVGIQVHPYDKAGDDWKGFIEVLTQGCKAVRDVCPAAKIIIHTERAGKTDDTEYFYQKLSALDYDIIGLSFYPIWHAGSATKPLSVLSATLDRLAEKFPTKQVQIVETAYNYEWWPKDGVKYDTQKVWPCSAAGQQQYTKDLIEELGKHDNVNGLFWWFPEENGNGGPKWDANTIVINGWIDRGLWDNNNHKALPALYELKNYRTDLSSLSTIFDERQEDTVYDILGQRVSQMRRGNIYIRNGRKVVIR